MATLYKAPDHTAPFRAAQRTKVTVGSAVIQASAIAREMQNHEAPTALESWREAARALAVRELLLQEAHRLGLLPAPISDGDGRRETEEEALIRTVVETEVVTPEPDEATCRRYYERNATRFRSADLFEVAHILLPAREGDLDARAAMRDRASALLAHLSSRPEDFADLAREHSACPSAASGGNLGQIKRGDTVAEFEHAIARMTAGEVAAEPVETRYGLHIVRLDRCIEGRQLPFELVQARIAAYLRERSNRQATAQYLALLAARTPVTGVDLPQPSDLGVM